MAATKPVTPLPVIDARSSRWAASSVMPTASTGSSTPVFWSSMRISTTLYCSTSCVQCRMFDFKQLDPLVDRHVGDFVGRQIGQLDARLVDRGELLLLQHVGGDVANRDDQMLRRLTVLDDRSRVDAEVAMVAAQASRRCLCRW